MGILTRINAALEKLAEVLTIVFLGGIAIVVPLEVFNRYITGNMFTWSTEFCQYSFVWASMMGAAAGLRKGGQGAITSLKDRLEKTSARAARGLQALVYVIMLLFLAVMTRYGIVQVVTNYTQLSSTMSIPMSYPYAGLPLGFVIMFTVTLEMLIGLSRGGKAGRD
jgi:TRAP-type C4-dicarboxylate transport system permease small subunit